MPAEDPRWARLTSAPYRCASCDREHVGIVDLGCSAPAMWTGSQTHEPNRVVRIDGRRDSVLTNDFCIMHDDDGVHCFVRAVLRLPIVGAPQGEELGYGVWSSLAHANFERYVATFDSREQGGEGPWFGWFSSQLPGYPETLLLKCRVHPVDGGGRPWLELEPTDHPLAIEQRDGITIDRLLEIYALNGHDITLA